jgi:hypothetical protein
LCLCTQLASFISLVCKKYPECLDIAAILEYLTFALRDARGAFDVVVLSAILERMAGVVPIGEMSDDMVRLPCAERPLSILLTVMP